MVLVLASLFIVSGCGIPTYLYIPESSIEWNSEQSDEKDSLEVTLNLYDDALSTINEKVKEGPSIKFFYVLSTNSSEYAGSFTESNYSLLSEVSSAFNTHYKGSTGNGYPWSPQSDSMAPGFYLYTPAGGSTHTFSAYRPDESEMHETPDGILVGTFSQSIPNDSTGYFGTAPYMDFLVPVSTMTDTNGDGIKDFAFTLEKQQQEDAGLHLKLSVQSEILFFSDYKKSLFPDDAKDAKNQLIEEDKYFYDGINSDFDNLYLHIWASLYGGEGDFTNIYWSELQYLGCIELF